MTTQTAEQFEYRHPLQIFDISAASEEELRFMAGMAMIYADGYRDVGDLERAERFEAALAEIRRRLEADRDQEREDREAALGGMWP